MKNWILASLVLVSVNIAAEPIRTVSAGIDELLGILKSGNSDAKARGLCGFIKRRADIGSISTDMLGAHYGKLAKDADGIKRFRALVPSILVDQVMDLLGSSGGGTYEILGTEAKGSSRIGVKVKISGRALNVVVGKSSEKILDVGYAGRSLVGGRGATYRSTLAGYSRANVSLPVTELVKDLENKLDYKCN